MYNTFWNATNLTSGMIGRFSKVPNVVGLKWATPRTDAMEFEDVTSIIRQPLHDHRQQSLLSLLGHAGARRPAFEVHLCNYWPEWGIKLIDEVRRATIPRSPA